MKGILFDERGLQVRHFIWGADAFDRRDVVAVVHTSERQARVDASPVHQNGAGPALAVIAALFRAGQAKVVAQGIQKRGARIVIQLIFGIVDL